MDKKSATGNSNDKQEPSSAPPVPDDLNDDTPPTYEDRTDEVKDETKSLADDISMPGPVATAPKPSNPLKRFLTSYWHKKRLTLPLTLLVILGIIAAVPQTRYPVLALGIKRNFTVTVTDSKTNNPVSGASVTLDGHTATTDNVGDAKFSARVGKRTLTITKQYYKGATENVFVGISTAHNSGSVELVATGRQVPVKIINKITGQPVANAEIKALDTNAKTDDKGTANIVLPTKSATQAVTVTASGYNDLSAKVQVTDQVVDANTFTLTPAGRIYFLSNLSGKIDVVATDLDGGNRKTVLAGTGKEDKYDTVLLATRDWKYLALLSKRDGGDHAKLYLINTANDQLTTMDEGTADFNPVGWSNHYFVYQVSRTNVKDWENGQSALKSFNADNGKIVAIDQTTAEGTQTSYLEKRFGFVNLIGDRVIYGFNWFDSAPSMVAMGGKSNSIISVNPDGSSKKDLRDIALQGTEYNYFQVILYKPDTLYIGYFANQPGVYYVYSNDNNTLTQSSTVNDDAFNKAQENAATYLIAPSDKSTLWAEPRDGKNTIFVGDYEGDNGKQIASLSDYTPYGWFTDNYLLVQKNDSELYILPSGGGTALKISDYYKPSRNFFGYGGGYGGL